VHPDDGRQRGSILGSDGDGSRRPAAGPDHWHGHLVATAEGKFVLDATLDQTRLAPPLVIEIPDPRWWAGGWPLFIQIPGRQVRYAAFPGRGGYKSAPDFRPCRRKEIVTNVVAELAAAESMRRATAQRVATRDCFC
jgi:hypothetical protein